MAVYRNPNRLRELFSAASMSEAAEAILSLKDRGVLKVLGWAWLIVLGMVFTLIYIVRIASSLPVWPQ